MTPPCFLGWSSGPEAAWSTTGLDWAWSWDRLAHDSLGGPLVCENPGQPCDLLTAGKGGGGGSGSGIRQSSLCHLLLKCSDKLLASQDHQEQGMRQTKPRPSTGPGAPGTVTATGSSTLQSVEEAGAESPEQQPPAPWAQRRVSSQHTGTCQEGAAALSQAPCVRSYPPWAFFSHATRGQKYWVGQKVRLGFSIRPYGENLN